MRPLESMFFWIALVLYVFSILLYLLESVFRRDLRRLSCTVVGGAFAAHSLTIAYRWIVTGHPPALGIYENTLSTSWIVAVLFLILQWRFEKARPLGVVVFPFIVLTLGYGITSDPKLELLTTAYAGYWVWVHILFSWLAYSCYVIAGIVSVALLWKSRKGAREDISNDSNIDKLDSVALRYTLFGFISQSIMIVSGSIWAHRVTGSFWDWAEVEIYSLVSWIFYGLYLHLRYSFQWRGRRAAWMALAAFLVVLYSFWGVSHLMGKGGMLMELPQY